MGNCDCKNDKLDDICQINEGEYFNEEEENKETMDNTLMSQKEIKNAKLSL